VSRQELAAVPHERQTGCGLPIGDLRGFGRVRADASLVGLALDRSAGVLCASGAAQPLLSLLLDTDAVWSSAYVPGTNVLESTARTASGELRVVDFMGLAEGRPGQAEAIPAGQFVRIVTCTEGEVAFEMACEGGFRAGESFAAEAAPTMVVARAGWYLACSRALRIDDDTAVAPVRLGAGESVALVISEAAVQGGAGLVASALHALGETIHYWTWWSDRCRYKGEDFDTVLREALSLKLACSTAGLQIEDPGATGFAPAPLGEMCRVAARFLDLGYRHECAELLAFVHEQSPATDHGRWAREDAFVETFDRYVARYGDAGLPASLRAVAHVPPPQSCTA
jgi:hypothetical protein